MAVKSSYQQAMEGRISALVSPIVTEAGYDLVELQLIQRKSSSLLRFVVDRIGGITLDECAELSRRISYLLEVEDPIEKHYTLEVTSPGLGRPLLTASDFRRKVGERVRLFLNNDAGRVQIEGEIVAVEQKELIMKTAAGEERFALEAVIKGKTLY